MKKLYLMVITLLLLMSCKEYAESETFLIPNNYTGVIVIVFDQEKGASKEYKDKRRIYHIPKNGVLYTKFSPVNGILDEQFYYINDKGKKLDTIKRIVFEKLPKEEFNYILDQYDGGFSVLPKEGITKGNSDDYPSVNWIYLTIGKNKESRDSLRGLANTVIDKITKIYPKQIE